MQNSQTHAPARCRSHVLLLIVTCLLLSLAVPLAQAQREDENMEVDDGGVRELRGASARSLPSVPVAPSGLAADAVLLEMASAFRKKDTATLSTLLPQASGHPLEAWAAYWELSTRLPTATAGEVDAFLRRWQGTYHEDRLRNDWLLLLGKNRDFASFARYYPGFRMRDDREVRCYALYADAQQGKSAADDVLVLRENWFGQRDADDACTLAASAFYARRTIGEDDIWRKARLAAASNRMSAARAAVAIADSAAAASVPAAFASPARYLATAGAAGRSSRELAVLALFRMAAASPPQAAQAMQAEWGARLQAAERDAVWAQIGRQAALNLDAQAMHYFGQIGQLRHVSDDSLGWMARAALRMGDWPRALQAIEAMSPGAQREPVWTYWKARTLQAGMKPSAAQAQEAAALYRRIAGNQGFYEQLAQEALGQAITVPRQPAPLTAQERAAARAHPSLQRALQAVQIGLRSEGTREWNYATNLHQYGGMNDRDLLAAADLACQQQWWDRCINTSERTKGVVDMQQRFPMPYRSVVVARSQQIGLDPAYVYGLIRQESRFALSARSSAGAGGLMQVMPATARWTARKLGISYSAGMLHDLDTNIQLGTGYLKITLDDFGGSYPLAAAAYNAGPNRPRAWRNGPVMEGAIWAENIPFGETRDYVKKVLANSVNYAVLLTGQPQSLTQRLGQVAPLLPGMPDAAAELQ